MLDIKMYFSNFELEKNACLYINIETMKMSYKTTEKRLSTGHFQILALSV